MILFEQFDADALLDAIEPHRCSWLIGVPFMYAAIVERQKIRPRAASSDDNGRWPARKFAQRSSTSASLRT
jgi:acyl-CoA synthetase (AMP-forming)/AMP-acid ligase II